MIRRSTKHAYEDSTRKFLDAYDASTSGGADFDDIVGFRLAARQLQLDHTCDVPRDVEIENLHVPGSEHVIPLRVYRHKNSAGPKPVLVYFHGGAWVIGGLDECDGVCAHLCRHGDVTVVSVDYRLAPEHRFPAAVIDSVDAVQWVAKNAGDLNVLGNKIGVAGDSAGGNLAAVVCQQTKQLGGASISRQVLLYPCLAPSNTDQYPSQLAFGGEECFLNKTGLDYMVGLYRRSPADDLDARLWPILGTNLQGLPDAYIVTAEFDMLLDEAKAYADSLVNAGVGVEYKSYGGTIHGFICFAGTIQPGAQALDDLSIYLRDW